jgi:hypothetical protein
VKATINGHEKALKKFQYEHRSLSRASFGQFANLWTKENDDLCAACSGGGTVLMCERCPRSFHLTCVNPPFGETPEGTWYCRACETQRAPPREEPRGMFSALIDNMNCRNPSSFRLPASIRNYFVGVETGVTGEYKDSNETKTQKYRYVDQYCPC